MQTTHRNTLGLSGMKGCVSGLTPQTSLCLLLQKGQEFQSQRQGVEITHAPDLPVTGQAQPTVCLKSGIGPKPDSESQPMSTV